MGAKGSKEPDFASYTYISTPRDSKGSDQPCSLNYLVSWLVLLPMKTLFHYVTDFYNTGHGDYQENIFLSLSQ